MRSDDRKKITANEFYMNECMSILYTKIKANGINMFKEDGSSSQEYIINVENYQHGTVTYGCSSHAIKVNYDGTNFAPTIKVDEDNSGFAYKLKPLGLEYLCKDRPIGDGIYEKRVMRTVGICSEYFRYLNCETFFVLLDYCSKDENGKTVVINSKVTNYTDEELVCYMKEQMQKADELESQFDDEGILTEDEAMAIEENFDDFADVHPVVEDSFSESELDEIEAYSSDDYYDDICEVDFSLAESLKDSVNDEPYKSEYPEKIEDFDYQKYIRGIESGVEVKYDKDEYDYSTEADTDTFEESNEEMEEDACGEYDEECDDGLYSASDTIINDEGFIDDAVFEVMRNGKVVEDSTKSDIVDIAVTSIMDVNQEIMTLKDYYVDIYTELRKIRAIIQTRNERMTNRKPSQSGSDVDQKYGKKIDKDIDE